MKKWMFLSVVCLAVLSAGAFGSIGVSTDQTWTFDDADNPADPEIDNNPFGVASASIIPSGDVTYGGHGWSSGYAGHEGYWFGDQVIVDLTIPNNPEPNWYKDVWVTIVGRGHLLGTDLYAGSGYLLGTGYEVLSSASSVVDLGYTAAYIPGDAPWLQICFGIRIYPNPESETIRFTLLDSGAVVDSIYVWTECVPEPATMLLLSLGGVAGLIRRKR